MEELSGEDVKNVNKLAESFKANGLAANMTEAVQMAKDVILGTSRLKEQKKASEFEKEMEDVKEDVEKPVGEVSYEEVRKDIEASGAAKEEDVSSEKQDPDSPAYDVSAETRTVSELMGESAKAEKPRKSDEDASAAEENPEQEEDE